MTLSHHRHTRLVLAAALLFFSLHAVYSRAATATPRQLPYLVVKEYPHDPTAFTQGLAWNKGVVYEGTGLYGYSSLRRVDIATGVVAQQRDNDKQVFGEGITVLGDSIYQLTWQNGLIFEYDKDSFSLRRTWSYPRQGWGLTHDGRHLIASDGTANLYFLDPESMMEQRRITVRESGKEVDQLNELEYVNGSIYANIWQACRIAVINPEDGTVTAWLDLSALCQRMQRGTDDVLNGIMYDSEGNRLFVTGKLWPTLFEISHGADR